MAMSGNDGKDVDEGINLGNKRHRPEDEVNDDDDEPSTRRHENGSSSLTRISGRTTLSRALRPLPAGRLSDRVNVRWQSDTHAPVILSGLQQLYNDRNLCDVTIRVDGEDFQAHRVVLAASSDFLRLIHFFCKRASYGEIFCSSLPRTLHSCKTPSTLY